MNAHALTYPALRRRLVAQRRARALFLRPTTQHVETRTLAREVGRAAVALAPFARTSLLGAMQKPIFDGPVDLRAR